MNDAATAAAVKTETAAKPAATPAAKTTPEKKAANISVAELSTMLSSSPTKTNGAAKTKPEERPGGEQRETAPKPGAKQGTTQTVSDPPRGTETTETTKEKPAAKTETASADVQTGLAALKLNADQQSKIEALIADGGEIDPEALGLSKEQTSGLEKYLTNAPAEAATGAEEPEVPGEKKELHPELQAAIDAAKAGGQKGLADVLKRVHTLVDQRDTERMGRLNAERNAQQLQQQVAELKKNPSPAAAQSTGDPVKDHPAVRELSTKIAELDGYIAWAEQNPDGAELPDGKGGSQFFDAAAVRKVQRNAERTRSDLVTQRSVAEQQVHASHTEAYTKFHAEAVRHYPSLAQADSPDAVLMKQLLTAVPQLRSFPDHELVIGDYIRGQKARLAAAKNGGSVKRATIKQPARVVAATSHSEANEDPDEKETGVKEQKQFERSGRTTDLAKAFAARRRATSARR